MDSPEVCGEILDRFHADLAIVHKVVGTFATIERAIKKDDRPVRRILDIGCGGGDLLRYLQTRMKVEVIGIDLKLGTTNGIPMVVADATKDMLPQADLAISSLMAHHLTPAQNVAMIRNVGRSCKRFVIHDLIRHPLPLALFSVFVCPLLGYEAAADGRLSVRRAFTPPEFEDLIRQALDGTSGSWTLDVSPFRSRQIADIRF